MSKLAPARAARAPATSTAARSTRSSPAGTRKPASYGAQWVAAVTATEPSSSTGLAVTFAGKIVTAYYFSSSGGRTQNSEDVWVTALPWARSVDDHWSLDPAINPTYASWAVDRTQAQVAAAFGLPNVVKVAVTARTAGGGVSTETAWSSTGAVAAISGETLRSRLGLPSTWLKGGPGVRTVGAAPWPGSPSGQPGRRQPLVSPTP